jgi:hypothetical protein
MAVGLEGIANEQQLEVGVNGPDGANRMFVIDGTAAFTLTPGAGNDTISDTLRFPVGPTLTPAQFVRAIATASLASIANGGLANNAQWAVNSVDADLDDQTGRVVVTADLAVGDTDGYLQRIGFQATILARL